MSRFTVAENPVFASLHDASAVTKKRFLTAIHCCTPGYSTVVSSGIPAADFDPLQPPESPPTRYGFKGESSSP